MPGETEAGSAGMQPCRGIAWWKLIEHDQRRAASIALLRPLIGFDRFPHALKIPAPKGRNSTHHGNASTPFPAEPLQKHVLITRHRRENLTQGRDFYDIIAVLAEALSEGERTTLLTRALSSGSAKLIHRILTTVKGREYTVGSPDQISARLTDVERLQLLTALDDKTIVRLLDRVIFDSSVRIQLHEIRRSVLRHPRIRKEDVYTELSSLGARAAHETPLVKLQSITWRAYESHGLLEELGWRVRHRTGAPTKSALAEFLRSTSPRNAVRELILPSMPVTLFVTGELWLDAEDFGDGGLLADRILWKIGFHPSRYDELLGLLRNRVQHFSETLFRIGTVNSEENRERIRSAGVNLFVALEQFVEDLVAYNVWVLASDHFVTTNFTYRRSEALSCVSKVIGDTVISGAETFRWNTNGGNALGTLLVYAQSAAKWMASLPSDEASALRRPTEDLPHFADQPERPFPFRHRMLWPDAQPTAIRGFAEGFETIVSLLSQANVAAVRNGLDHMRTEESFPTMDVMLLCAARLREAFEQADVRRYYPKLLWLSTRQSDRFGRFEYHAEDYLGRPVILNGPSPIAGGYNLAYDEPFVVPAGDLLGEYSATLHFRLQASGPYADYWRGYPRRLQLPSPQEQRSLTESDAS